MNLPDGKTLVVHEGILQESTPDGRIILWLRAERAGGYQHWERFLTVARATVITDQGVCSIAATSVPVRRRLGGALGKFLSGLGKSRAEQVWTLPGGATATQCGARRTGLILAWAEDAAVPLDEARVKAIWPEHQESRSPGPNLYIVSGIVLEQPPSEAAPAFERPAEESPSAIAERALKSASAAGDGPRVVTALADLGIALLFEGDTRRAAATLGEARAGARRLGDPALEADAMSNLALAACHSGQPGQARGLITPVLGYTRDVGDRYAEKLALDRLAQALVGLGDHAGALAHLLQAATLAADLDDRQHEALLLWRAAIEHAELGRRDQALACAGAAVDRLRGLDNPKAGWYAHHLASFRSGAPGAALAAPAASVSNLGGSIEAGALTAPAVPRPAPAETATGPGLLRMALTATKALASFAGSGFKTASTESYHARLAVCAACEHHTGVRCRVCGCITGAKARLLHERCPAGRWPA